MSVPTLRLRVSMTSGPFRLWVPRLETCSTVAKRTARTWWIRHSNGVEMRQAFDCRDRLPRQKEPWIHDRLAPWPGQAGVPERWIAVRLRRVPRAVRRGEKLLRISFMSLHAKSGPSTGVVGIRSPRAGDNGSPRRFSHDSNRTRDSRSRRV